MNRHKAFFRKMLCKLPKAWRATTHDEIFADRGQEFAWAQSRTARPGTATWTCLHFTRGLGLTSSSLRDPELRRRVQNQVVSPSTAKVARIRLDRGRISNVAKTLLAARTYAVHSPVGRILGDEAEKLSLSICRARAFFHRRNRRRPDRLGSTADHSNPRQITRTGPSQTWQIS